MIAETYYEWKGGPAVLSLESETAEEYEKLCGIVNRSARDVYVKIIRKTDDKIVVVFNLVETPDWS